MNTSLRTIATSFALAALTATGLATSAAAAPAPAGNSTWGNPDIPTASQARKEIQEGKRPYCTATRAGTGAYGTCTNKTDETYYAAVQISCDRGGTQGAVVNSTTFTIPPHSTASATVSCPAGTASRFPNINGPLTMKEAKAVNENLLEATIKSFL